MPARKRQFIKNLGKTKAEKRKQETPEQRAIRLERQRNYARYRRQNESESQRQERLIAMRQYVSIGRQRKKKEMRQEKFALITERLNDPKAKAPKKTNTKKKNTNKLRKIKPTQKN